MYNVHVIICMPCFSVHCICPILFHDLWRPFLLLLSSNCFVPFNIAFDPRKPRPTGKDNFQHSLLARGYAKLAPIDQYNRQCPNVFENKKNCFFPILIVEIFFKFLGLILMINFFSSLFNFKWWIKYFNEIPWHWKIYYYDYLLKIIHCYGGI